MHFAAVFFMLIKFASIAFEFSTKFILHYRSTLLFSTKCNKNLFLGQCILVQFICIVFMYQGTLALEELGRGIQTSKNKTFSKGEKGKSFYVGWLRSCKMHLLSRQDATIIVFE